MKPKKDNKPLIIANIVVNPGEHKLLALPSASLFTQTPINIPVHVFHGLKAGPKVFITAAIHGDEINGVEIIRRLLRHSALKYLNGTLIIVPVANVYGFLILSRYLPDRRDLNRAFPGSKSGSLAARIANLYMEEIIQHCTHGIDLHTGNIHINNLPHIRINAAVPGTVELSHAFNVPVIIDARLRDGSIRQAAAELNIPVIVYEGGEALRFDELAIKIGLRGVLRVLHSLGMIESKKPKHDKQIKPRIAPGSSWCRSPVSGIFHPQRLLGTDVEKGEKLGLVADPFTKNEMEVTAPIKGIIIGRATLPLVNEGDALFNIAKIKSGEEVTTEINQLQEHYLENPFD